jgi:putative mRNA 3-end processing factor
LPQRPIEVDILVTDATYGHPKFTKLFGKEFVVRQLLRLVKQRIKTVPIQIHSTQGKAQEVMELLRKNDVQAPFIMPKKMHAWASVYKSYGRKLGECIPYESTEAQEIIRSKAEYILFFTIGYKMLDFNNFFCLKISGREPSYPFQEVTKNYYTLTISDHADFNELLKFIKATRAKVVVTDGSRPGDSIKLANEIKRKLAIEAWSMPS